MVSKRFNIIEHQRFDEPRGNTAKLADNMDSHGARLSRKFVGLSGANLVVFG